MPPQSVRLSISPLFVMERSLNWRTQERDFLCLRCVSMIALIICSAREDTLFEFSHEGPPESGKHRRESVTHIFLWRFLREQMTPGTSQNLFSWGAQCLFAFYGAPLYLL